MAPYKKKPILADKISSLLSAAPTNVVSDDESEETKAKLVDHYEESDDSSVDATKGSKIRRQNAQLLDELDKRYVGVKVSRKDIYEETHGSNSDSNDVDTVDPIEEEQDEDSSNRDEDEEDEEDEEGEGEGEEEEEEEISEEEEDDGEQDVDRENPLYRERKAVGDSNFRTISSANIKEEIDKGKCVQSQLKIWENLLEMRIRLQKCLIVGNRMPQYDNHKEFRKDVEFANKTNEARTKLTLLLDSMLNLQAALWKQFPETKSLDGNKTAKGGVRDKEDAGTEDLMDEEISSESEGEEYDESNENKTDYDDTSVEKNDELPKKKFKFSDYEKILEKRHKSYVNYRNSVISKWNDKTRVTTGKVNKSGSETTLKQIDFALSDMAKSRKRTQLKRSEYDVIGKSNIVENDDGRRIHEYDTEIYDDDDFYHQLLRDLIEYKSADIVDPVQLSKQWIQLQSMRSKMKRKIDTRATKGRRVRYNVHNKLVNYMAPITVNDTWTDLAKNELYNSLFGKIAPVETIQNKS